MCKLVTRKMAEAINTLLNGAKKDKANLKKLKEVSVVLGNETCDLDSAVSSLTYSLLLQTTNAVDSVIVPVLNIPRVHLPLKTEVTYILNKHKVDLNNIICRDEIDLRSLHDAGCLRLTLVDHHVLAPQDRDLADCVETVLDHRPPDPAWPWPHADVTLRTVGSCCTLVAERLLSQAPQLLSPVVAEMLLGAILLDTACLSETAGRAEPEDHSVARQLQKLCGSSFSQLFKELQAAKSDVSGLSTAQLLIKDLKVAAGIPIAGLPIKVQEFLRRPDARDSVRQLCVEHNSSACVIYGSEVSGGSVTRDVAVFAADSTSISHLIVAALTSSNDPDFNLQPQPSLVDGFELFQQLNVRLTRKQMLPIVRAVSEQQANQSGQDASLNT